MEEGGEFESKAKLLRLLWSDPKLSMKDKLNFAIERGFFDLISLAITGYDEESILQGKPRKDLFGNGKTRLPFFNKVHDLDEVVDFFCCYVQILKDTSLKAEQKDTSLKAEQLEQLDSYGLMSYFQLTEDYLTKLESAKEKSESEFTELKSLYSVDLVETIELHIKKFPASSNLVETSVKSGRDTRIRGEGSDHVKIIVNELIRAIGDFELQRHRGRPSYKIIMKNPSIAWWPRVFVLFGSAYKGYLTQDLTFKIQAMVYESSQPFNQAASITQPANKQEWDKYLSLAPNGISTAVLQLIFVFEGWPVLSQKDAGKVCEDVGKKRSEGWKLYLVRSIVGSVDNYNSSQVLKFLQRESVRIGTIKKWIMVLNLVLSPRAKQKMERLFSDLE